MKELKTKEDWDGVLKRQTEKSLEYDGKAFEKLEMVLKWEDSEVLLYKVLWYTGSHSCFSGPWYGDYILYRKTSKQFFFIEWESLQKDLPKYFGAHNHFLYPEE